MTSRRLTWAIAPLTISIALSLQAQDKDIALEQVLLGTLGQDQCQATYSATDQTLIIPCVAVNIQGQSVTYQVVLKQTADSFGLQSVTETTLPSQTTCRADYDLTSGKLDIPCIDGVESIKDLTLYATNPNNPSLFALEKASSNRRVSTSTKCNTSYGNAAYRAWSSSDRPNYDRLLSASSDRVKGIDTDYRIFDLARETFAASISLGQTASISTKKEIASSLLGVANMIVSGVDTNNPVWQSAIGEFIDGGALLIDPTPESISAYFANHAGAIWNNYTSAWKAWTVVKEATQLNLERDILEKLHLYCATNDQGKNDAIKAITVNTDYTNLFNNCSYNDYYKCLIQKSALYDSSIDVNVVANRISAVWNSTHQTARNLGYDISLPKTWYGNGSVVAYSSRSKADRQSFGFGLIEDESKYIRRDTNDSPGAFFFQWHKEDSSGKRLRISGEGFSSKVSITYGKWNTPQDHVTFKNVTLPFVLDPCNDFASQICSESNFFTVAVSLDQAESQADIHVTATNDFPASITNKTKGSYVTVDGRTWTGTGSIINYSGGDIEAFGLSHDSLKFIWGPNIPDPVVFFQWQVKRDKPTLMISTNDSCLSGLKITYGRWSDRSKDKTITTSGSSYQIKIDPNDSTQYSSGGNTWYVIKVVPNIPANCYSSTTLKSANIDADAIAQ